MHNIRKRNGEIVPFVKEKISDAIHKANLESIDNTFDQKRLPQLADEVVKELGREKVPAVEFIQDVVEKVLSKNNYASTAKA